METFPLTVIRTRKSTSNSITITLAYPTSGQEHFNYYSGQYLTIECVIDQQTYRRCYSLNSSPSYDNNLEITVKAIENGTVSNYLQNSIKEGDTLHVLPPSGNFQLHIQPNDYQSIYCFAAGSGITPIYSMIKTVLSTTNESFVYLLYGNSTEESIIFKTELDELQRMYPDRFILCYTLTKSSIWENWKGLKGRIDAQHIEQFLANHPPIAQTSRYFICGPGAMNTSSHDALLDLGVPNSDIFIEHFGSKKGTTKAPSVEEAQLSVRIRSEQHSILVKGGQTLLEALKKNHLNPPYSCESGICSTCVARLTSGKVQQKSTFGLSESDQEKGLILCCQALPDSSEISIDF